LFGIVWRAKVRTSRKTITANRQICNGRDVSALLHPAPLAIRIGRLLQLRIKPYDGNMTLTVLQRLLLILVALLAMSSGNASRHEYPEKPLRLILPFPGGEGEAVARIIALAVGKSLGQSVVVENKPGAAGNIAAEFVARSPADGYTLLMGFSTIFEINPLLYRELRFDVADFAPVSLVAETHLVLVVNPSLPVNSVKELIDYAKANPGKLTFASAGVGSRCILPASSSCRAPALNFCTFRTRAVVPLPLPYLAALQTCFSAR
jgi:hypothetical protein